ncbi:MAG: NAD(P)/FAD-dependent oxidoreductase [Pelatocladus maniniholoensis HA4357-MV3]|jgi:cation diffusion facilitator CzcD-associated flavoprotein CzcO|uniref:NAD(P)/FAD-dependent oxidoreductase n=1 Tax=Pelatocladus maniniholoensis HA4357-MV3 TaxID=1117104 RepID=A0A9E3H9X9_9NOST|nr:NAD(P)/FAD-dependent oxidoreductase [Pelatocladus maniniholoensis HA4357-MV3]BAZ70257.1 dimethylaniline monooxygenase (N-oxide forming) [Fischerella sp. NIES-4106]
MNAKLDVIVIGAGFCGITVAASLKKFGINNFIVIEKGETVATIWKNAYERLVTQNPYFTLPFFEGKGKYSTFKTKDEMVQYLTEYAYHFQVDSHTRFGEEVQSITKIYNQNQTDNYWQIQTTKDILYSKILVICTGLNNEPVIPNFCGQECFSGRIIHSSAYKNGFSYKSKKVLVIGSGNSAAEIALDLYEHGAARVDMLIRGQRWVFPLYPRLRSLQYWLWRSRSYFKQLFNQTTTDTRIEAMERAIDFSPEELQTYIKETDKFIQRFALDLSAYSIYPEDKGPMDVEVNQGRVAWVDRGTVKQIKKGNIQVISSNIQQLTKTGVIFANGVAQDYDAIILGTGFRPSINKILRQPELYLNVNDRLLPKTDSKCQSIVDPTLYFVGFEKIVGASATYGYYGWCTGKRIALQLLERPFLSHQKLQIRL